MSSQNTCRLNSALAAVLSACCLTYSYAQYDVTFSEVLSGVPTTTEARYRCSFANSWTSRSHPVDYPDTSSTWESPALAAHTSKFKLWREGELATKGVETFAKVGTLESTLSPTHLLLLFLLGCFFYAPLKLFFFSLSQTGQTLDLIVGFLEGGDQSKDFEIGPPQDAGDGAKSLFFGDLKVSQDAPILSSIAKMSPSPDWFTGFHSLDLRRSTTDPNMPQQWQREFRVDTYTFTAGTLSGETYLEAGEELDPKVPIRQLNSGGETLSTGVLLARSGEQTLPVATWECTLVNAVEFVVETNPPTVIESVIEAPGMNNSNSTMDANSTATQEPEFLSNATDVPVEEPEIQNENEVAVQRGFPFRRRAA